MCLTKNQATQIYEDIGKNGSNNIQIANQDIKNESKVRNKQE